MTTQPASPRGFDTPCRVGLLAPLQRLPEPVRKLADRSFDMLKSASNHPSFRLKKVGRYWTVRIGLRHRAVAVEAPDGLVWFWIGSHGEYGPLIGS